MRALVASCLVGAAASHELNLSAEGGCVAPGTCQPPPAKYTRLVGVRPRQQWEISGGFCGALSIQSAALGVGAWISQDLVRKANTHGEGHGSPSKGYEILPTNVGETARNLKLDAEEWDYSQPKPQAPAFKAFIKRHLAQGHPVVWFPICKGDSHSPYAGSAPNGGAFDHVEPMLGIGSNHPLNDTTVYDDDWILHGSDQDLETYYRFMHTLEDDKRMEGNCKDAGAGFGKSEMYPCFYDQVTYGLAVKGLQKEGNLPVVLDVDRQDEPDVRFFGRPVDLHGTVRVSGLAAGKKYVLYRYAGTDSLPVGSATQGYEHMTPFTAEEEAWTFQDPNAFSSHSATYYVAMAADVDIVV